MAMELQQQQQQQDYQQQIYFQTMEEVHLPKDIFDEDFKKNESFVSNKVGYCFIGMQKNLVVQGSNVIQLIGSKCDSISIIQYQSLVFSH